MSDDKKNLPVKKETNLPVKKETNLPAKPLSSRGYARVAASATGDASLLKFNKGKWITGWGDDKEELSVGTQLIIHMAEFRQGWIRFSNGEKTDERMVRVALDERMAYRDDLGDLDRGRWGRDTNGTLTDPWSENWNVSVAVLETKKQLLFVTGSKGGFSALGKLCDTFVDECEQRPGQFLLVELDAGSYQHSNRAFGSVDIPIFDVVGWVDEEGTAAAKPEAPDLDDDIPF